LTEQGAIARTRFRRVHFDWKSIRDARVEVRPATATLFGFSRQAYEKRLLVLDSPHEEVQIDLSTQYPEFSDPEGIEQEVRKYVDVREVSVDSKERQYWLYRSPLVALPVFVAVGMWVALEYWL
jgi:hypothetical protein